METIIYIVTLIVLAIGIWNTIDNLRLSEKEKDKCKAHQTHEEKLTKLRYGIKGK